MSPAEKQTEHRWAVDSIEESTARIEEDGARMISVPASLLPAGAKEGKLLRVLRTTAESGAVTLTIALDEAGTASALRKSKATVQTAMDESFKRDKGGDVSL
jgi:hypothetical protein